MKLDNTCNHNMFFASLLRAWLTLKVFLSFLSLYLLVLLLLVAKLGSKDSDIGRDGLKMQAAGSTNGELPAKMA